MKYFLFFVLIPVITLVSCDDKSNEITGLDFTISGLDETTLSAGSQKDIDILVYSPGKEEGEVNLSIRDIPENVEMTLSQETGKTDFSVNLTIIAGTAAVPGDYLVKFVGTDSHNFTRTVVFHLIITS